ncbi:MAG: hypothetical protein RLY20_2118, partial [Verrucomicrobiota bacterium]
MTPCAKLAQLFAQRLRKSDRTASFSGRKTRWHGSCKVRIARRYAAHAVRPCSQKPKLTENNMKKLTQMLALAGVAALCLSTGTVFAQDNGGPGGGPGGDQGGPGGGRGGRQGGRGNFDPAQMQQRFNERIKEAFGSTDDEWKAIEPLVTKVNELRRDQMMRGFRGAFGGRGGQGGPGGAQASTEETALN